jgi:hypothetical protein
MKTLRDKRMAILSGCQIYIVDYPI